MHPINRRDHAILLMLGCIHKGLPIMAGMLAKAAAHWARKAEGN